MNYNAKKQFNGFVSVRDYVVQDCMKKNEPLVIHYDGKIMTIPADQLTGWQMHSKQFVSKFNHKKYTLFDFKFIDDGDRKEEAVQLRLL